MYHERLEKGYSKDEIQRPGPSDQGYAEAEGSDAKGDRLSWPGRLYQPDRYGHRADHDEQYVETLWGVFRIWDGYTVGMRGRYLKSQYGVHGNLYRNIPGMPANLGL